MLPVSWFDSWAESAPARIFGHQGDDLLPHQRLRHHLLRACQARFQADQDPVALVQEGDGSHRVEARFASQVLQHVETVHLGEVQAEQEQVGGAMPGEKAQRLQRIIEAGDLVALAVEDDLEDLARGRRGVQHDDPQLPCHVRSSLLLCRCPVCAQPPFPISTASIACLPHALLMSVHRAHAPAHDSLTAFGQ